MVSFQLVFIVTVALTISSGTAAISIVMLGDTRKNAGQRAVAEKFAHIALIGVVAIAALLRWPD